MTSLTAAECSEESLASEEYRTTLRYQFLAGNILAKGKMRPTKEDYLPLCLDGKRYTAIGREGGGAEGQVYTIQNKKGDTFALKVYDHNKRGYQQADLLAIQKAKKSRDYITVPVEVNREYGYTIYPLMAMPYALRPQPQDFYRFVKEMDRALAEDGLAIEDSHEKNFMYDANGRLWRVDLSTLHEL